MKANETYTSSKAWYSYKGGEYNDGPPYFYDLSSVEWVKSMEINFPVIKAEIENFMQSKGTTLRPYFNSDLVDLKKSWKVSEFYFWSRRDEAMCKYIPQLNKIFSAIPGFVSAGVSTLSPNTDIKPHFGDTNTTIRVHLGLTIPEPYPTCGIQVGSEEKGWEEGKVLIFCDANKHRAWNHSNSVRYVLIIDILKDQFLKQKKNVCANVLSLIALQKLEYKAKFIRSLPGFIRGGIRVMLKSFILIRL
jgi:aspartyl/asparaginyl beta-hydroxylase (cupin superfamily)